MADNKFQELFNDVESILMAIDSYEEMLKNKLKSEEEYLSTQGHSATSFKQFVKAVNAEKLQEVVEKGELFKSSYEKIR